MTLAILAVLRRRGLTVAPFKVGPDFIDPGHHAAVSGRTSRNLDGWMCGEKWVRRTFAAGSAGADLALVEGVMGLFDGASGDSEEGSTAEVAKWLDGRVVLVVDARSQARSAAALVHGFATFDPDLRFAGIIFNRVGSPRHEELLRQAVESVPGLPPVLGCLPRDAELTLGERHLGLVTAQDAPLGEAMCDRLADWVEEHIDLDALVRLSEPGEAQEPPQASRHDLTPRVRIAVARDEAFCFYYPDNLALLEAAGAELVPFSPLRDTALPEGIDGLYLGGGYPELKAEQLGSNRELLDEIRTAARSGLPVYAECGGFMLLSESIDGQAMAGVFPVKARMLEKRKALGYREVAFKDDTPLGPAGTLVRGHEFHYSEMVIPEEVPRLYRMSRRGGVDLGAEGYRVHNVLGSYVHLHFGSNPQVAENFVSFCRKSKA